MRRARYGGGELLLEACVESVRPLAKVLGADALEMG